MTTACSCPADAAMQKRSSTFCGISACASFILTMDDCTFNLVKTGLEVCHAKLNLNKECVLYRMCST